VVRQASVPHPDTTEVDSRLWWEAWATASTGLLDDVKAIGVGGQQHGVVAPDSVGDVVRPALLWNDTRSAANAADLVAEGGRCLGEGSGVGTAHPGVFAGKSIGQVAESPRRRSAEQGGSAPRLALRLSPDSMVRRSPPKGRGHHYGSFKAAPARPRQETRRPEWFLRPMTTRS
jgi:hypothetical protein